MTSLKFMKSTWVKNNFLDSMNNKRKKLQIDKYKVEKIKLIQMIFLICIQQSGQMSGHIPTQTGN